MNRRRPIYDWRILSELLIWVLNQKIHNKLKTHIIVYELIRISSLILAILSVWIRVGIQVVLILVVIKRLAIKRRER